MSVREGRSRRGGVPRPSPAPALAGAVLALALLLGGCSGGMLFTVPEDEPVATLGCGTPLAPHFAAKPRQGYAPLAVQFSSQGSSITEWSWDFGDGETSTLASPVHVYTTPGTYTVSLSVVRLVDSGGRTTTSRHEREDCVVVLGRPDLLVTDVSYSPAVPMLGSRIAFDVTVRNQGSGPAKRFAVSLAGARSTARATIAVLEPGYSAVVHFVLRLSRDPETFTARADDKSRVAESDESNNATQVVVSGGSSP